MTRLEISIYGFNPNMNYETLFDNEFDLVRDEEIFHIQSGDEQWLRLVKKINQCALISNKNTLEIYMFWYGSSLTNRTACVSTKLKKENVEENPIEWENAKTWMISQYGFSNVPIFDIELNVEKSLVEFTRPVKKAIYLTEQPEQPEQSEQLEKKKRGRPKKIKTEQPEREKKKLGRPTKEEQEKRRIQEEERRKQLPEEERKKEDDEKELKLIKQEERRKRKEERRTQNILIEGEQENEVKHIPRKNIYVDEPYYEERDVLFSTIPKFWIKIGETMLTPTHKPTKIYMSKDSNKPIKTPPCPHTEEDIYLYPSKILSDTKYIQWRFRVKNCHKRMSLNR